MVGLGMDFSQRFSFTFTLGKLKQVLLNFCLFSVSFNPVLGVPHPSPNIGGSVLCYQIQLRR